MLGEIKKEGNFNSSIPLLLFIFMVKYYYTELKLQYGTHVKVVFLFFSLWFVLPQSQSWLGVCIRFSSVCI